MKLQFEHSLLQLSTHACTNARTQTHKTIRLHNRHHGTRHTILSRKCSTSVAVVPVKVASVHRVGNYTYTSSQAPLSAGSANFIAHSAEMERTALLLQYICMWRKYVAVAFLCSKGCAWTNRQSSRSLAQASSVKTEIDRFNGRWFCIRTAHEAGMSGYMSLSEHKPCDARNSDGPKRASITRAYSVQL